MLFSYDFYIRKTPPLTYLTNVSAAKLSKFEKERVSSILGSTFPGLLELKEANNLAPLCAVLTLDRVKLGQGHSATSGRCSRPMLLKIKMRKYEQRMQT